MRKIKRFAALLLSLLLILSMTGCSNFAEQVRSRFNGSSEKSGSGYNIYYLNQNGTGLLGMSYQLTSTTENEIIAECMNALTMESEDGAYRPVLNGPAVVEDYKYDKETRTLAIYFGQTFESMPAYTQLLTRAAVVKTMTQFRSIVEYVTINIGGKWLTAEDGSVLKMDRNEFVSEITNDLDLLEDAKLTLYFVSGSGSRLAAYETTQRYYNYSKNSLAAIVMDALLRGPVTDQYRSPLSSSTQVRSIHISDGVCTVDFNQAFLTPVEEVPYELTVYSVVNTLCELSSISQVQITVEGEAVTAAPSNMDLTAPLTAKPELIE